MKLNWKVWKKISFLRITNTALVRARCCCILFGVSLLVLFFVHFLLQLFAQPHFVVVGNRCTLKWIFRFGALFCSSAAHMSNVYGSFFKTKQTKIKLRKCVCCSVEIMKRQWKMIRSWKATTTCMWARERERLNWLGARLAGCLVWWTLPLMCAHTHDMFVVILSQSFFEKFRMCVCVLFSWLFNANPLFVHLTNTAQPPSRHRPRDVLHALWSANSSVVRLMNFAEYSWIVCNLDVCYFSWMRARTRSRF